MLRYVSVAEMRAADEYTINTLKVPSERLMQRAGEAIFQEVCAVAKKKGQVLIVCGTGNNGGDGYVAARLLADKGYKVKVYALGGRLSEDCKREKERYGGEYAATICGDIIVDCIFGTGLSRAPEGESAQAIKAINQSGAYVIAADIPSGLNAAGQAVGVAVKAHKTIAIGELKTCFILNDGADYCGEVIRKDIGICLNEKQYCCVLQDQDIAKFYPERPRNTHKGSYGCATLVCGSKQYIGSAVLAAAAANISGCGYVKVMSNAAVRAAIAPQYPQTVFIKNLSNASHTAAVGMGLGISKKTYALVKYLIKNCKTLIIDADGLNSLAKYGAQVLKQKDCKVIITPHVKEFSRLTGKSCEQILADPVGEAKKFSREYGVITLLKGASSVITDGERVYINTRGGTALAKAGSGDMLAGYMCGSIARGIEPLESAFCAAYTLGVAAELAEQKYTGYCAYHKNILECIPKAVLQFMGQNLKSSE